MSLHKEIRLEVEICEHLAAHGWLYSEGDAAHYDRARALFPADVLAWVQTAQQAAWDALVKNHGPAAADTLLDRLRAQLDQRGTLDVLRHGLELLGLKQPLALAQFKPSLAMNPDILARYGHNVIDAQLQDALFGFSRTAGVVATIKGESRAKSAELAEALSGTKKIVVCTIQTFPFALEAVRELAATQGKCFAVYVQFDSAKRRRLSSS